MTLQERIKASAAELVRVLEESEKEHKESTKERDAKLNENWEEEGHPVEIKIAAPYCPSLGRHFDKMKYAEEFILQMRQILYQFAHPKKGKKGREVGVNFVMQQDVFEELIRQVFVKAISKLLVESEKEHWYEQRQIPFDYGKEFKRKELKNTGKDEITKTCYELRDKLNSYHERVKSDSPESEGLNKLLGFDLRIALILFQNRSKAHVHKLAECLKSFYYNWG